MRKPTNTIQMLLLMLFVILVGFASYKSFQVVGLTKFHSASTELKTEEEKEKAALVGANPCEVNEKKRQLAQTLWQENQFAEAQKLLPKTTDEPEHRVFDINYVNNSLTSASLMLDAGEFTQAIGLYQKVLAYERKNLGNSCPQIARDLNSLGVASYLAGQANELASRRNSYFRQASDYYAQAAEITRRTENDPNSSWRLDRILSNWDLSLRQLNRANQPPFDYEKYLHNQIL